MKKQIILLCALAVSLTATSKSSYQVPRLGDDKPFNSNIPDGVLPKQVKISFESSSNILKIWFLDNIPNVNINIYKENREIISESYQNVSSNDTQLYHLAPYGTGSFTICISSESTILMIHHIDIE